MGRPRRLALPWGLGLTLLAACGSVTTRLPAPTPTPGIQRPADPGRAVLEAAARTAAFADVSYRHVDGVTTASATFHYLGTVTGTQHPPRVETRTDPAMGTGGPALDVVDDLAAGTMCTSSPGVASQRVAGQTISVGEVDPFYDLKIEGRAWKYLSDITLGSHRTWRVRGDVVRNLAGVTVTASSAEVFIDTVTGKITQVIDDINFTAAGSATDSIRTLTNFTYNGGAAIAAC